MFKNISKFAFCAFFLLLFAGCAGSSSVDGGLNPTETIVLDEDFSAAIAVEKGDVFALDMQSPQTKGYRISGAFFDPDMLRMERFLEYDDDGQARARYLFTAVAEGATDVLIRMTPEGGGDAVIYRQVTVTVGKGKGWFD